MGFSGLVNCAQQAPEGPMVKPRTQASLRAGR